MRFELNNKSIAEKLKKLRHEYSFLRKMIPSDFLEKRNTNNDIGKNYKNEKIKRTTELEIIRSSFGRTQESMRVIEEYAKLFSSDLSIKAKNIRFQLYDLEKIVINEYEKHLLQFPDNFGLYLIMTNPKIGYEKMAEIAVKNRIKVIQLRDKDLNDNKLLKIAKNIRKITEKTNTLFFVNDRLDITILSNADGIHVGQTDLPIKDIRKINNKLLIGKSTHNIKQLKNALKEQPDYIGIGPIYKTFSKKIPDPVLGLNKAKQMLKISTIPSIGIGGIKDHNLNEVLSIGFKNYSIVSYIMDSENPDRIIKKIKRINRSYYDTKNRSNKRQYN